MKKSLLNATNRLVVSNVFSKLHTSDKDLLDNLSVRLEVQGIY